MSSNFIAGQGDDQAPVSPIHLTCTAQNDGHVMSPVLSHCQIDGPINFSININSTNAALISEPVTASQALPVNQAIPQPVSDIAQTKLQIQYMCELKGNLRRRFSHVIEGQNQHGQMKLLNQIYTELYITEGGIGQVNTEHEVLQIEEATRMKEIQEIPIKCNNIFQPMHGHGRPPRTVMTIGVAGIGKTVTVQKFILDWAEGKDNQDFEFVFPLPFRRLNLMKKHYTLIELLNEFFNEMQRPEISTSKVLFVLDGLDECRLPLDFQGNDRCCDVKVSAPVDVVLTNLIKGYLLPSAFIWITSRPAAASQIPSEWVDLVTEVRGFNNLQKEEYFRKRISNEEMANRIIAHVKSSRSIFIMCHIPVFCWIIATVLEKLLRKTMSEEMPKSLTQMYCYFLASQEINMNVKLFGRKQSNPSMTRTSLLSLGQLAFRQLEKGHLIFYEDDLRENDIDVNQATLFSGVYTEIFSEELTLCQGKVFCFVHLSVQEFLAALYVFLKFNNDNENMLTKRSSLSRLITDSPATRLYKAAVDKAIQSESGQLDLFLRSLLGLSLESNHSHLGGLLTQRKHSLHTRTEVVKYIKEKIQVSPSWERCINLLHCLNEMNDHSLVQEIQHYLSSGRLSAVKLSKAQWSALGYILLTSEEDLGVFDLKKYICSEEGLIRLLPVVKASHTAILKGCQLTKASVLSCSHLKELDLSENFLQDTGVELLSTYLGSPHCKLETLRLQCCSLTKQSCKVLATVLSLNSSHLKELDLSDNELQDSGVQLLSEGLGCTRCKLDTLKLSFCRITEVGCAHLASALNSNPDFLREVDLSFNHHRVRMLSALLKDPRCRLEKLCLDGCAELRVNPGPQRYAREFTLDLNTAHTDLSLSEGNTRVVRGTEQLYPDHSDRFDFWRQVFCLEGISARCYWEVEWSVKATIGVAYRRMCRKGEGCDSWLGQNDASWSLDCSSGGYSVCHNKKTVSITVPHISSRIGLYLDWPAGKLSFYKVSSGTLTHLHSFHTTFTERLYPGFRLGWIKSSVALVQGWHDPTHLRTCRPPRPGLA
ncbi:NLR family CARD domain-containing protein 3-like [Osmerus mordax]|uniref:NLR family CARD domain-containing protein 3-like n=1 Tax=Osmerus mordax TaxID=8014 RepID=UPI00350F7AC2